jgi:hypothetical protein
LLSAGKIPGQDWSPYGSDYAEPTLRLNGWDWGDLQQEQPITSSMIKNERI